MLSTIHDYFYPSTASVLTKITTMIDALDNVNTKHTAKAMKHSEVAVAHRDAANAAFSEAGTANTAASKIAGAFGVSRS